ncbi:alanine racemase [Peptostreptococcus faecalis]|uniref:alanine racemase n=1 Tax=Peptostreptococcus faecalis TaxID=2045015 RepID=UPI000C7B051F|nr:alanine racemase [Peptostreptococcus faecalis]
MEKLIKTSNWIEINLDNLEYNFKGIKKRLPEGTKICMVVKSNAYGHGAVELSRIYEEYGADYLAVARVKEALELRNNGIKLPILNLGYTSPIAVEESIKQNVSMTIFDYEFAKEISEKAKSLGMDAKVHIKLDTGMSRLGYVVSNDNIEDIAQEIKKIGELENITVEGIYTHFATADAENKEFENLQMSRFSDVLGELEKLNILPKYRHCSNSAEILDEEERYNMVRPGIIQYGVYPSDEVKHTIDLKPVMVFKAKVTNVKIVQPGTSISYGRTYFTTVVEKIATIAIGYTDGFLRGRKNPYVYIKGVKCPVVGRICMDQTMVRVPMDLDVNIDDDVTIFGDENVSVDDVAIECDTISHEVMCKIGRRVERIYIKNGEIINAVSYLR